MTVTVKFMAKPDWAPGSEAYDDHSIYAGVNSVHFTRNPDGSATARLWVCEPVKTAIVPGFVECEKHVDITGNVYVLNDDGKTISVFRHQRPAPFHEVRAA